MARNAFDNHAELYIIMSLNDSEQYQALTDFASSVVKDARLELAAKQPKKSYRAKWKGGQLQSYTTTTKRYASDNSKELSSSLRYEIKEVLGNLLVVFYAKDYWYYVNFGRKGKLGINGLPPKPDAVGAKPPIINAWVKEKPVRPQKGGGAGFAKNTESARRSLAFMINRKIKTFGIEGNMFFTKTINIYSDELRDTLGKRVANDLLKRISKWPLQ